MDKCFPKAQNTALLLQLCAHNSALLIHLGVFLRWDNDHIDHSNAAEKQGKSERRHRWGKKEGREVYVWEAYGFATIIFLLDLFLSRFLWLAKLLLLHKWVCFYSESEGEKKREFQESVMHNIRKQLTGNSVSYLVAKCLHTSKINKYLRLWGEFFWVILVFLSWRTFSVEYGFALIWKS